MSPRFNKLARFIPAIIWMSFIFFLSTRSTIGIGHAATDRFLILKSFHLIEYAILSVLLFFGYKKISLAVLTAYLYACSDELHQYFVPGRTSRFTDTLIDLLGITIGLLALNIVLKIPQIKKLFS